MWWWSGDKAEDWVLGDDLTRCTFVNGDPVRSVWGNLSSLNWSDGFILRSLSCSFPFQVNWSVRCLIWTCTTRELFLNYVIKIVSCEEKKKGTMFSSQSVENQQEPDADLVMRVSCTPLHPRDRPSQLLLNQPMSASITQMNDGFASAYLWAIRFSLCLQASQQDRMWFFYYSPACQ